jgi:hypothetical protein
MEFPKKKFNDILLTLHLVYRAFFNFLENGNGYAKKISCFVNYREKFDYLDSQSPDYKF